MKRTEEVNKKVTLTTDTQKFSIRHESTPLFGHELTLTMRTLASSDHLSFHRDHLEELIDLLRAMQEELKVQEK